MAAHIVPISPKDPLHFLSDCHRRIEESIEFVAALLRKKNGAELLPLEEIDLRSALDCLRKLMPLHEQDEEGSLFPRVRASEDPDAWVVGPTMSSLETEQRIVDQVYAEVDGIGRQWLRERSLTFLDVWRLKKLLKELKNSFHHHVVVEESELFPLAEKVLCATCKSGMVHEMLERRGLEEPHHETVSAGIK